jgi:hypothetical protein
MKSSPQSVVMAIRRDWPRAATDLSEDPAGQVGQPPLDHGEYGQSDQPGASGIRPEQIFS